MAVVTGKTDKPQQGGSASTIDKPDTVIGPIPLPSDKSENSDGVRRQHQAWFRNRLPISMQMKRTSVLIGETIYTLAWIADIILLYHYILQVSLPIVDSNLGEMIGLTFKGIEIDLTYREIQTGLAVLLGSKFILLWLVFKGIKKSSKPKLRIWLIGQIIMTFMLAIFAVFYGLYNWAYYSSGFLAVLGFAYLLLVIFRCLTIQNVYQILYSLEIATCKMKVCTRVCQPCRRRIFLGIKPGQQQKLMTGPAKAKLARDLEMMVAASYHQKVDFDWERFRRVVSSAAANIRSMETMEKEGEMVAAAAAAEILDGAKPTKCG